MPARTGRARLGARLLALLGPRSDEAAGLSRDEWRALDLVADEHRLRPHLHGLLTRGAIRASVPGAVAAGWKDAHRANALAMLTQRRALLGALAVLRERGIKAVALKGSVLAWTVWPAPAERAMRDIDLLLPAERVSEGWLALRAAGWEGEDGDRGWLDAIAATVRHLPPLTSPDGVDCELHARPWDGADDETVRAMLARARLDADGVLVSSPDDQLGHLAIHAALSHCFDAGPLVLADIDYLVATEPVDWPGFWRRADSGGWTRAAALTLALTDRWRRPGLMTEAACPLTVPDEALADAEALIAQPAAARGAVNAIGSRAARLHRARLSPATLTHFARRALALGLELRDRETRAAVRRARRVAAFLSGD